MSAERRTDFAIERIVAALDATTQDMEPLATAVRLAARLGAAVDCLFIEDINLFRMASSPIARHISFGLPQPDPPTADALERELQTLAARAEAMLGESAARVGVRWSFRVVRDLPASALPSASETENLVVFGETKRLPGLSLRFGSPLRDAVCRSAVSALFAPLNDAPRRPLVALPAGSPLTERALAAAARVAGPDAGAIDILLTGDPAASPGAEDRAKAALAGLGRGGRVRWTRGLDAERLIGALRQGGNDVLVVTDDLAGLDADDGLRDLMASVACHLLIVRA